MEKGNRADMPVEAATLIFFFCLGISFWARGGGHVALSGGDRVRAHGPGPCLPCAPALRMGAPLLCFLSVHVLRVCSDPVPSVIDREACCRVARLFGLMRLH